MASRSEAMLAFCHDCLGGYNDGKNSCSNLRCPLFTWMPYRNKDEEPDLWWEAYNPRSKGLVLKEDSKREMTDEQREVLAARLEKARAARAANGGGDDDETDL